MWVQCGDLCVRGAPLEASQVYHIFPRTARLRKQIGNCIPEVTIRSALVIESDPQCLLSLSATAIERT